MSTPYPISKAAEPHQTVVVAAAAPQQAIGPQAPQQRYQSTLRGLAIAEIILGSLCVILGAAVTGVVTERKNDYYYSSYYDRYGSYWRYGILFTTGEGIYCGVWIIIAGALGVGAAKANSSRCLINTHLGFSIVASVASGVLLIVGSIAAAYGLYVPSVIGLYITLSVLAFASMILHILSASYCCASLGCCCSSSNNNEPIGYIPQVAYNVQPAAVPGGIVYTQQGAVQVQGAHTQLPQGYVYYGGQPMVQTTFPGSTGLQPASIPPHQVGGTPASVVTQIPTNPEPKTQADPPPIYSNA